MSSYLIVVLAVLLVGAVCTAVAALSIGGVPERRPPSSPRDNGGFDVWPFF